MSYAIKNLRDIDDSAVKFGFSEIGEARFVREDVGAKDTGLAYHVLKPGCRQAFGHRHEAAEELHVVIAGSGRVKLGDEIRDIAKLDVIRISPEVPRAFEAGGEGLEILVFGPHHKGDGELLKEFWTD